VEGAVTNVQRTKSIVPSKGEARSYIYEGLELYGSLWKFTIANACGGGERKLVDESTTMSPQPVSQFGDLSIGNFLSDHIVTGAGTDAHDVTRLIHSAAAGADASCISRVFLLLSFLCTVEYTHTILPNFHIVTGAVAYTDLSRSGDVLYDRSGGVLYDRSGGVLYGRRR